MMSVDAGPDGLPVIVAKLEGVAVYLDNWAIIELANGDPKRRERFVNALKSCGSLMFSFTNSIELGEAEHEPANARALVPGRNRGALDPNRAKSVDGDGPRDRGQTNPTPCISTLFIETFTKDRMFEQSPGGSKVVDLSPENFSRSRR